MSSRSKAELQEERVREWLDTPEAGTVRGKIRSISISRTRWFAASRSIFAGVHAKVINGFTATSSNGVTERAAPLSRAAFDIHDAIVESV